MGKSSTRSSTQRTTPPRPLHTVPPAQRTALASLAATMLDLTRAQLQIEWTQRSIAIWTALATWAPPITVLVLPTQPRALMALLGTVAAPHMALPTLDHTLLQRSTQLILALIATWTALATWVLLSMVLVLTQVVPTPLALESAAAILPALLRTMVHTTVQCSISLIQRWIQTVMGPATWAPLSTVLVLTKPPPAPPTLAHTAATCLISLILAWTATVMDRRPWGTISVTRWCRGAEICTQA